MDRRQQKTRKAIFKAFTELLAQKKYDRITVQEIIDRADVGRSTFYAHFETREALLEAMCAELFEHVTHAHGHSEGTHDFSETQDNLDTELTHILYHLRDDRKNMQGLLSGESSELFLGSMKKDVGVIFKRQLKDQLQNRQVPESFLLNHIACSFVEMLHWWVQNEMRQTPETMARYFAAVIQPVLGDDFTKVPK